MKTLIEALPAPVLHWVTEQNIKNYQRFRNFFLRQSPEAIEAFREKYLLYTFHHNAQHIPQYKKFLQQHQVNHSAIHNIQDFLDKVPETNKKSYIFSTPYLTKLCLDGDYHNINMLVKSSGHSGKQCYWATSHRTDLFAQTILSIGLDQNFQISTKKTLIINGFILGSWVTGILFSEFASSHCTVINTGPDKEEIFQTITDIGDQYQQILIAGYPPFIKEFVDYGKAIKFPWKKHTFHFAAGGEDFPEAWRDYIMKQAHGAKIRSGFGASDIGILGGIETDDTVFIRRLAEKNKHLRKALFGDVQENPMLFQYPTNLFIHTNEQQELVFTTILPEAVEPVIKYNLEDIGGILSYHEMEEKLHRFGIHRTFSLPLPFLFVVGRVSGPVKFHAFLMYPENVEDCVYKNPEIAKTTTGKFKLRTIVTRDHEHVLQIEFQLKKGVRKSSKLLLGYTTLCTKTLAEVNGGYKAVYTRIQEKAIPRIKLYTYEQYPYTSKIKNRYS